MAIKSNRSFVEQEICESSESKGRDPANKAPFTMFLTPQGQDKCAPANRKSVTDNSQDRGTLALGRKEPGLLSHVHTSRVRPGEGVLCSYSCHLKEQPL